MYRPDATRKLRKYRRKIKRLKAMFTVVSLSSLAMMIICCFAVPFCVLDMINAIVYAVFFGLLGVASAACAEAVEE